MTLAQLILLLDAIAWLLLIWLTVSGIQHKRDHAPAIFWATIFAAIAILNVYASGSLAT